MLIDRPWFKIVFGLLVAVPLTVLLGFLSYMGLAGGLVTMLATSSTNAGSVILALWGLAGFLGVAGGWMRLCIPSARFARSPRLRYVTVGFLTCGVIAGLAFIVPSIGGSPSTYWVPVSIFGGVVLIGLWLIWITVRA